MRDAWKGLVLLAVITAAASVGVRVLLAPSDPLGALEERAEREESKANLVGAHELREEARGLREEWRKRLDGREQAEEAVHHQLQTETLTQRLKYLDDLLVYLGMERSAFLAETSGSSEERLRAVERAIRRAEGQINTGREQKLDRSRERAERKEP